MQVFVGSGSKKIYIQLHKVLKKIFSALVRADTRLSKFENILLQGSGEMVLI